VAQALRGILPGLYESMNLPGPYTPDAKAAGCRALRQAALALITRLDDGATAARQVASADNMTEELGALACLLSVGNGAGGEALSDFYRRWRDDRLVIDKWFSLQIAQAMPDRAADVARALTEHPDFDWRNPNRFRAVFGALATHPAGFHRADGAAYDLMADWLIRLDPVNPQTTARMSTAFETLGRYDADRQDLMRAALSRIANTPGLSRDTGEMVGRLLGG
jgi:aminopeptidase N